MGGKIKIAGVDFRKWVMKDRTDPNKFVLGCEPESTEANAYVFSSEKDALDQINISFSGARFRTLPKITWVGEDGKEKPLKIPSSWEIAK